MVRVRMSVVVCGLFFFSDVVAIVQEFGRDAGHDGVVRDGFVYDGVGSDDGVFAHTDASEHDGAFADACMVAYCGNARVFGITSPYCNLLSDRYIVANLCFRMDDDAHAAIAESRALADMGLVRDLAIVDEEDEQRDELREKRHVVQIEPACDTVKVNGVEHEMQINC